MANNGSVKILIADDFPVVREGLRLLLSDEFPTVSFGEASNSCQVLRLVDEQFWDVVVLDIQMPGRDGLETLKDLKNKHPSLPVLILTMYPEDEFAERAIHNGADGYLNKESEPAEVLNAIKKVMNGGKYLSDGLAEKLVFRSPVELDEPPHRNLSDRELQIMLMLAVGKSLSAISSELALSVKTIGTYRARLLTKMSMASNAEVIRYALKHRLVV